MPEIELSHTDIEALEKKVKSGTLPDEEAKFLHFMVNQAKAKIQQGKDEEGPSWKFDIWKYKF